MSDREHEALLARERGEPTDVDLSAYERITDAIGRRAHHHRPPADFDDRLWTAIDRVAPASQRTRRWPVAAAVVALAAAALLAVWFGRDRRDPPATRLALVIERGDQQRRGDDAQPGDRLRVTARDDTRHIELRLYRDDRTLVTACSDQPPCHRADGALRATLPLAHAGTYQLVILRSDVAPPAPTGDFGRDTAAAIEAGAVSDDRQIDVR